MVEAMEAVLVLPDLGTAPVVRFREMLRRLVKALVDADASDAACMPRLLITTPNIDGDGARAIAWRQLTQRLWIDAGLEHLQVTVLDWERVETTPGPGIHGGPGPMASTTNPRQPVRARRADELLDLVGRHPFLTVEQIAAFLAVSPRRIRQLRRSLVGRGLVRVLRICELDASASQAIADRGGELEFAELTSAGRRRLARMLGLPTAAARHHHGIFGGSARRRRRALRALAHTIGANGVFVALAVGARAARARGQDEALEEWRPAAACERRRCKPDGYGCYRRGNARYGFFLEYDRGTERARQYNSKLTGYYAYRDDGHADFNGFPTVLFVTTSAAAEKRIVAASERAWARFGGVPLPILVTTDERIAGNWFSGVGSR